MVSMAGEHDEMLENMSKYISHNEDRSQRLQDRVNELEEELHHSRIDGSIANTSKYDLATNVKGNEKQQKANAQQFRKQQSEIEELRDMLQKEKETDAEGKRVWADKLQTFVAQPQETTRVNVATKGINA